MNEIRLPTATDDRNEGATLSGDAPTTSVPARSSEECPRPIASHSNQQATTESSQIPSKTTAVSQASQTDAAEPAPLWLRRTDQAVVAALVTTVLLLVGFQLVKVGWWRGEAVEVERLPSSWYEYKIDVNRATWVEWAQLEGIGETLARRIVEDREERGSFRGVDDVLRVKGIGPKKLELIRRHLYAQGDP